MIFISEPRDQRLSTLHARRVAADIALDVLLVLDRHGGRFVGSRERLAREIIECNGQRPDWMRNGPPTKYLARGIRLARRILYPDVEIRAIPARALRIGKRLYDLRVTRPS